jgi:hypothetical protein
MQVPGGDPRVSGVSVGPGVDPTHPRTVVGHDGGELRDRRLDPDPLAGEAGQSGVQHDHESARITPVVITALSMDVQPGDVLVARDELAA